MQAKAVRQEKKALASSELPSKYAPNVTLSTPQKLAKLAALAREKGVSARRLRQLQEQIAKLTSENGVDVEEELAADLALIMEQASEKVCSTFAEGSFQHLFWKQQMEAHLATKPQQRRWHPLLIKWCLNLRISSAAYNLCTSGMLLLPSERTLRDYSNVVKSGDGFKMEVLEQLYNEARMGQDEIPAHRQFVGIAVDEIYKIRSCLRPPFCKSDWICQPWCCG